MINKQDIKETIPDTNKKIDEPGIMDVAKMDVQCHILIKDKDSDKILLNRRG